MKNYLVIRLLLCMVFIQHAAYGQSPVNSFTTVSNIVVPGGTLSQTITSHSASVNGILPNTNYTVTYNNDANVRITSFTLSGKSYVQFSTFDTVILRRVANAWESTGGNKQHIYCQGPSVPDNITFKMPFPVAYPVVANYAYMERVMKEGYINRGSDNVFNNDATTDATANNIERVDFVYKTGLATINVNYAGFLIAERGGNDAFKIAAITGIDINGNPTSFGSVLSVGVASYGAAILTTATYVMRKDPADNVLRPFSLVPSQSVKSIYISFNDLGITPMKKVYGYALMGNDVTATTSAQVLNYNNSTYFPTNTINTDGGMDIASAPGIFHTNQVLDGHYISLTAQNKNCEQVLQWSDNDYTQVKEYQVEKSFDMENFERLNSVDSRKGLTAYSYTDNKYTGPCNYRVKVILLSGVSYYSSIIFAKSTCSPGTVTLYPNPVKDQLNLSYSNDMHINKVTLVSVEGREIGNWDVNQNTQQIKFDLGALPTGHYFIRLNDVNKGQKAYPVVKL